MASRYAAVVRPGRPPYTLRRPKNLRRMVGEREFSESLNVRDTPCYITRRHGAGGTGKSDSGGAASLVLGVVPKFQLKSPPDHGASGVKG